MLADPGGAPQAVLGNGVWRRVTRLRDRWRVDDRWWTEQPVSRLYYELELENGEVLTLFHDRLENRWYRQRA